MNYEKIKGFVLVAMLAGLITFTFRVSPLVDIICVIVLSVCFWIQAISFRKHTKEKNVMTKTFLTVSWYVAALYATGSFFYLVVLLF